MDAIHYDKIADKLINFHSKLPEIIDLEEPYAIAMVKHMKVAIHKMLEDINEMADKDNHGWIR